MNEKINPIVLCCSTIPLEDTANSHFGGPIDYGLKSIHRNVQYHLEPSICNYAIK